MTSSTTNCTTPIRDPHQVLGISRHASEKEIKAAYRKLALLHHPDRVDASDPHKVRQANVQFAEISHAYERMMDERRQQQEQSSTPFYNDDASFSRSRNTHHAYRDPFEIFESVFREEFGGFPSSRTRIGRSGDPFAEVFRSPFFDHDDDFFAPFFGGNRSRRYTRDPFASFMGGFGSIRDDDDDDWMDRTNENRRNSRRQNREDEYDDDVQDSLWNRMHQHFQLPFDPNMHHPQRHSGGDGGGAQYFSTSSSTTRRSYRNERGERVETTETIRNVNGQEQITKETITHKADGTVERQFEQSGDPEVLEYFGGDNNKKGSNRNHPTEDRIESDASHSPQRRLMNWFSRHRSNHDDDDDRTRKR
jgi:curved DNA-binding protein CbpA